MWVIVDDIRDLNCDIIVRTSQIAMKVIPWIFDEIEVLILDHDLGDESYHDGDYLLKQLIESGWLPKRVQLATANPVGRQNMANRLEAEGYTAKDGRDFNKNV